MKRGKQTCKILKDIRRQIAEANDIEFITSECQYKGDCLGTCPKCEAELRYLERQLQARRVRGKSVAPAGISAGAIALMSSITSSAQLPDETLPAGDFECINSKIDSAFIKGNVFHYENNDSGILTKSPLIGVCVVNTRTSQGVVTDIDGNYAIEAGVGDTLQFIYVGYLPKIIEITDPNELYNIDLGPYEDLLGEVVAGGVFIPQYKEENILDIFVLDENKNPIDPEDVWVEKIYIDEDGEEDLETLHPLIIEDKKQLRFYWNEERELHDDDGNPLKSVKLLLTSDLYEDSIVLKVKYPKRITKKTVRFKHPKKD